jgi:hypothetical protein
MLSVVVGHPSEEVELLGSGLEQRLSGFGRRVVLAQQRCDDGGDVAGKLASGVAASSHHVHLLEDAERATDCLDLGTADPPGRHGSGLDCGDEPIAARGDRRAHGKDGGLQERSPVHVGPA